MSKRWRVWIDFDQPDDETGVYLSMGGYDIFEDGLPVTSQVTTYPRSVSRFWLETCDDLIEAAFGWHASQEAFPL